MQGRHEPLLISDATLLDDPHTESFLLVLNSLESQVQRLQLLGCLLAFLGTLLLLKEPSPLLEVNVENHSVDYDHLSEELESILSNVCRAVMQPANHSLKQREVVMARDHIGLSEFDEDLADLGSAIGTLVMEPPVEKLEELLLGLVVHRLGVGVTRLCREHKVDDVCKYLDDRLSKEVGLTVEEPKQGRNVLVDNLRRVFGEFPQEDAYVLDAHCLMRAVIVEDLLRELADDLIRHQGALSLGH